MANEPEAVDLPDEWELLESGSDERLFIQCGCGHNAAFHSDGGCTRVTPTKVESSTYSGTKTTESIACTCPTPREVVYLSGRKPEAVTK